MQGLLGMQFHPWEDPGPPSQPCHFSLLHCCLHCPFQTRPSFWGLSSLWGAPHGLVAPAEYGPGTPQSPRSRTGTAGKALSSVGLPRPPFLTVPFFFLPQVPRPPPSSLTSLIFPHRPSFRFRCHLWVNSHPNDPGRSHAGDDGKELPSVGGPSSPFWAVPFFSFHRFLDLHFQVLSSLTGLLATLGYPLTR